MSFQIISYFQESHETAFFSSSNCYILRHEYPFSKKSRLFFTPALFVVLVCSQEWFSFEMNRSCSMKVEHRMQFLSTIISEHQKSDVNCWDQIAKKMNVYLFEQKVSGSDVFFLDGADCERFFERNFLRYLPSRKSSHPDLPIAELLPYIRKAGIACAGKQLI